MAQAELLLEEVDQDTVKRGQHLHRLFVRSKEWVTWRHDTVTFEDETEVRVRSQVVVNCEGLCQAKKSGDLPLSEDGRLLLPIGLVRKDQYLSPEVWKSGNDLVMVLARHEARYLIRAGVLGFVWQALDNRQPSPWLTYWIMNSEVLDFQEIARDDPHLDDPGADRLAELYYEGRLLVRDRVVQLAAFYASFQPLVVVVPKNHDHDQILTYEMLRPAVSNSPTTRQQRRIARAEQDSCSFGSRGRMGFKALDLELRPLGAKMTAVDVLVPPGLQFNRGFYLYEPLPTGREITTPNTDGPRKSLEATRCRTLGRTVVGHEVDPNMPEKRRALRVEALLPPEGIVSSAPRSVAGAVAALSVGGFLVLRECDLSFPGVEDASVAVLLVVLGLAGPILAERPPHPLASQVQRSSRHVLYVVFAAAFAAAGAVAIGLSGALNVVVWFGAICVCLVSLAALIHQSHQVNNATPEDAP